MIAADVAIGGLVGVLAGAASAWGAMQHSVGRLLEVGREHERRLASVEKEQERAQLNTMRVAGLTGRIVDRLAQEGIFIRRHDDA